MDGTAVGPRPTMLYLALCVLAATTIVAVIGWYRASSDGSAAAPDCVVARAGSPWITFTAVYSNATQKADLSVEESDGEITVAYRLDEANDNHTDEGYGAELRYQLVEPLGDRAIVDTDGTPIPTC